LPYSRRNSTAPAATARPIRRPCSGPRRSRYIGWRAHRRAGRSPDRCCRACRRCRPRNMPAGRRAEVVRRARAAVTAEVCARGAGVGADRRAGVAAVLGRSRPHAVAGGVRPPLSLRVRRAVGRPTSVGAARAGTG
jgi:hypothetical protein